MTTFIEKVREATQKAIAEKQKPLDAIPGEMLQQIMNVANNGKNTCSFTPNYLDPDILRLLREQGFEAYFEGSAEKVPIDFTVHPLMQRFKWYVQW